jgi:hypothetical protein
MGEPSRTETPREPTSEQCGQNAETMLPDGRRAMACWYPQMGGYVGRALMVDDDGCLDVYVWHDGQFPFSDDGEYGVHVSPVLLHHCDATQFIAFGQQAARFLGEAEPERIEGAWRG